MPIEIEAKMRIKSPAEAEERLRACGARAIAVVRETNIFLDTPEESLKAKDQGLRVRIERIEGGANEVVVTHKGPRGAGSVKTRSETEFVAEDADQAVALFTALGFMPVLSFEKLRRRWEMDECEVVIDTLPRLGHFIEIEGPDEAMVLSVRKSLGMEGCPLLTQSYIGMLMDDLRKHGDMNRTLTL